MALWLSRRDRLVWTGAFLLVSTLLILTRFESEDPDSALYASLSARLAEGPPAQWIAPEWWGYWDSEGLFREHPIGVLILPTILGAAGIPAVQAAYIVGIGAAIGCLLLIANLVSRVGLDRDSRLVLTLLQVMPVAFIFRIRANHEYPMLLCLLLTIVGIEEVRRSWRWLPLPAAALAAALLIKGVFVAIPLLAAALWIGINPLGTRGSAARPLAACAVAVLAMAGTAALYDVLYLRATGQTFWGPYWTRQLAPLTISGPGGADSTFGSNLLFYIVRLVWHPAPWSLALLSAGWSWRRRLPGWRELREPIRRAVVFAVLFCTACILLLSTASRFAERYAFSASYAVATVGAVTALYVWPSLRRRLIALDDRVPTLPAICWLILMLLRLAVGPSLPRITS